jgi:hypothetical protein
LLLPWLRPSFMRYGTHAHPPNAHRSRKRIRSVWRLMSRNAVSALASIAKVWGGPCCRCSVKMACWRCRKRPHFSPCIDTAPRPGPFSSSLPTPLLATKHTVCPPSPFSSSVMCSSLRHGASNPRRAQKGSRPCQGAVQWR